MFVKRAPQKYKVLGLGDLERSGCSGEMNLSTDSGY